MSQWQRAPSRPPEGDLRTLELEPGGPPGTGALVQAPLYGDLRAAAANLIQEDWAYTMRRSMQEIVPGVFLGPYASAGRKAEPELKAKGITHVVCVRQEIEKNFIRPHHQGQFEYLVITLADGLLETLIPKARESKQFIDRCLKTGGKVLVHCNDGMSSSPSLVIAYLMETYCLDFKSALNHVQQRRFCVQPNDGFEQQLREFEPIYRARVEVAPRAQVEKRRRDEEDSEDIYQDEGGGKCKVVDREEGMEI